MPLSCLTQKNQKVMPKSCFVALDKDRLACNSDSTKIVYDVWL